MASNPIDLPNMESALEEILTDLRDKVSSLVIEVETLKQQIAVLQAGSPTTDAVRAALKAQPFSAVITFEDLAPEEG